MAILNVGEEFVDSTGEIFPVAPSGVYDARVLAVKDKMSGENSKHPGTPMWQIEFALEDANVEGVRVTLFQTLPVGEGTDWMDQREKKRRTDELKRLWNACGLPADAQIDSDDLKDCQLRLDVGVEEYNGKDKNTVRDLLVL